MKGAECRYAHGESELLVPLPRKKRSEFCAHMPLNKEITSKESAEEILDLCDQKMSEWDEVNLLTALHRVAKSPDRERVFSDSRFYVMVEEVWLTHSNFNGYALANTAWAFASLGWELPLIRALAAASLPMISDFGSQSIANMAWALARMQVVNCPLLNSLSAQALPTLTEANPQNLSNTAWAFSKRGFLPKPLMDAIAAAALPLITEFTSQEMANSVWSCSKL